jgi:CIC family chloride channel protein
MLGGAFWRLTEGSLPNMPDSPAPFVIIGMMAMFGGIAHAPLAVMLMVAEMTGNLTLLAPAMVAVAVSVALVGDRTIYKSQLPGRADSPAHRLRLSFPLLSSLRVRDVMRTAPPPELQDGAITLAPETTLPDALEQLAETRQSEAPVIDRGTPIGAVSVRDALATYRRWVSLNARRVSSLPSSTIMIEATLSPGSSLRGRELRAAGLPSPSLIVSIVRGGEAIFPTASTILEAADRLTILAPPDREAAVLALLSAQQSTESPDPAPAMNPS